MLPPLCIISVYIDAYFDTNEKKNIIWALLKWQKAFRGLVTFHIINLNSNNLLYDDKDSLLSFNILKCKSSYKIIKKVEKMEKTRQIFGCAYSLDRCSITLLVTDRISSKKQFKTVAMHEIGHMLRLGHNNTKHSLMYPYLYKSTKPSVSKQDICDLISIWKSYFNK